MTMSVPYECTGRKQQKARTRRALVEATRRLLTEGITPTVEQAADAGAISRTTAYRYFPNQRSLLLAAHPEIDLHTLLGDNPPTDPEARIDLAVKTLAELTVENEPELRTMLRLSLDPELGSHEHLVLRQGRAVGWILEAMAPLSERIPQAELRRLALAIRAACGIEALVWLTDIGGLSREEATRLMQWSARALFRAAISDASAAEPCIADS
ncbi:TetR/AcrR family transcriptional regulator [Sinorhizobium fredii]|uniref:TetR/AcrR family transcriptional regulator n=1 Tax=Rhizobium fredii TaxID=380 RepID=UPI0035174540